MEAFISTLPRDGEHYVVEGDLLMTGDEVRTYLSQASAARNYFEPGELVINTHGGVEDIYREPQGRKLVYTVERASFPSEAQFAQTVENMRAATQEWQHACVECGIEFEYRAQSAQTPPEPLNFTVRLHDVGGVYLAASFFPHSKSPRYLNVDPAYFSAAPQADLTGLLRHQLGHILGYRHAQTRIAGCYSEGARWLPVSTDGPKSVMQYHCAQGASSGDPSFAFTSGDLREHRRRYGLPRTSYAEGSSKPSDRNVLVIRYQGGKVLDNIASTLQVLKKLELLKTRPYEVSGSGETVQSIYTSGMRLPNFSASLLQFASELNDSKKLTNGPLDKGDVIRLPDDIVFNEYTQDLTLIKKSSEDHERLNDIVNNWEKEFYNVIKITDETLTRVKLEVYELRLVTASPEKSEDVFNAIEKDFAAKGKLKYLTLSVEGVREKKGAADRPQFFSVGLAPRADRDTTSARNGSNPLTTSQENGAGKPPNTVIDDADKFPTAADQFSFGFEWALGTLIGKQFDKYDCGEKCPQIVLVDQKVQDHQELKEVISGVWPAPLTSEAGSSTKLQDIGSPQTSDGGGKVHQFAYAPGIDHERKLEHGTYLAGIIASQRNGYGLIGIYPYTKILSVDFQHYNKGKERFEELQTELAKLQQNTRRNIVRQIYVSAASWLHDGGLGNDSARFLHPMARMIRDGNVIWVVAAGQAKANAPIPADREPRELNPQTERGPMNLGDEEGVIVVTAYKTIKGVGETLMDKVNRTSRTLGRMIHIAAPGISIPALPRDDQGGPVTRAMTEPLRRRPSSPGRGPMISRWPDAYVPESRDVENWLQVTSRPFFDVEAKIFHRVGIIEPKLAILDSRINHLKSRSNSGGVSPPHVPIGKIQWGGKTLEAKCDGSRVSVPTSDIYRLIRWERKVQVGDGSIDEVKWIIYIQETEKGKVIPGAIDKLAPCEINIGKGQSGSGESQPKPILFKVIDPKDPKNDKPYYLDGIEDLLLNTPSEEVLKPSDW